MTDRDPIVPGTGVQPLSARLVTDIAEIGEETWNRLANPISHNPLADNSPSQAFNSQAFISQAYNPFMDYRFLAALEQSSSVGPATGWSPAHVALEHDGRIIGLAANYLKQHSQGEYIFDHHWANAYERAGGRYYPKMLCAAPFTPAGGPRLLAADKTARAGLTEAIKAVCGQFELASASVNFVGDTDRAALAAGGFLHRQGIQYHWFNRDYASYDNFLATLSSRKRKAIRKERRLAADSGLTFRTVTGAEATSADWDAFWIFYQDTGARKWGHPYLTRSFFRLVAETMGDRILLIFADRDGTPIAGALNFIGGDTLYGRYWGCTEHHPFLHFEVCYHRAIDYAIAHGLARVEAGAQGEHKIARGYEPVAIHSMHHFADEGFRAAISRYLDAERDETKSEIDILSAYAPFKKG